MTIIRSILAGCGLLVAATMPLKADIYLWSQTPSANTNSDIADDLNWLEGMPPSEVNNSARALMSEVRKWIDDMGASIPASTLMTTGGTANVQTLTTNGTSSVLTHGWKVCFHVGAGLTPTGATTLNVDSLGAIAVQGVNGTALSGGEMAANTIQCAVYDSNDAVWQLVNHQPIDQTSIVYDSTGVIERAALTGDVAASVGSNTLTIQSAAVENSMLATDVYTKAVGEVFDFAGSTCPANSTEADGGTLNRTTHSDLFAVISTTFGIGDGSTTYNIPDLRDRVSLGDANMGGTDASRITHTSTTNVGDTGGEGQHTLTEGEMDAHVHALSTGGTGNQSASHSHSFSDTSTTQSASHTHYVSGQTGNQNASHNHNYSFPTYTTDFRGSGGAITERSGTTTLVSGNNNQSHSHAWSDTSDNQSVSHTHDVSGTTGNQGTSHSHTLTGNSSSIGSNTPFNVLQPFLVLTKCIFVGDQL